MTCFRHLWGGRTADGGLGEEKFEDIGRGDYYGTDSTAGGDTPISRPHLPGGSWKKERSTPRRQNNQMTRSQPLLDSFHFSKWFKTEKLIRGRLAFFVNWRRRKEIFV